MPKRHTRWPFYPTADKPETHAGYGWRMRLPLPLLSVACSGPLQQQISWRLCQEQSVRLLWDDFKASNLYTIPVTTDDFIHVLHNYVRILRIH